MIKRRRSTVCIFILSFLICLTAISSGCGRNKAAVLINEARAREEAQNAKDEWTIMLYLCGADLESEAGLASANLAEIAKVKLPENVNVLFATGGAQSWQTEGVDPNYIEYYLMSGQGEIKRLVQKKRVSMGEPLTLGEFLAYGSANYPARRYGVILWDHGGGVKGMAYDEIYQGDNLSLPELDRAFRLGNAHYSFVGMDACLMANLETAFTMEPYADYLIASEESIPGQGWDYAALMGAIAQDPNIGEERLGRIICDSYYKKCEKNGREDIATLSVIDLSKVYELGKAFDEMASEMTGMTEDIPRFKALRGGILRAENYGGNTDNEGYFNLVDIGDMILNAEDVLPQTGERALNALLDAVVYEVSGQARSHANGISTFYPLDGDPEGMQSYAENAAYSKNYLRFLEASTRDWAMPGSFKGIDFGTKEVRGNALSIGNTAFDITTKTYVDKRGNYTLEISGGADYLQQVHFTLFMMDEASKEFLYLGEDDDFMVNEDGDVYQDNFSGMWPALNRELISLNIMEQNEEYNLYSTPLLVNGEPVNMRSIFRFETEEYEILGLWPRDENAGAARGGSDFAHGDLVQVLMYGIDMETLEDVEYITGEFAVDTEVEIDEAGLPDGDYIYQFVYEDLLGRSVTSPSARIVCKKGKLEIEQLETW